MRRSTRFMLCASLSAMSAALACVLAAVASQRAGLPYSEEGHYFDGLVNYHQQSVLVYTMLAGAALLLALGLAGLALKARHSAP